MNKFRMYQRNVQQILLGIIFSFELQWGTRSKKVVQIGGHGVRETTKFFEQAKPAIRSVKISTIQSK